MKKYRIHLFLFPYISLTNNLVVHSQDPPLLSILEGADIPEEDWTIHDPSRVIVVGNTDVIAATGKAQVDGYNCGLETWWRNSDDGGLWEPGQCLFQTKPSWIETEVPDNDGAFWAPELVTSNILLYSISEFANDPAKTCVGVAFATGSDINELTWEDSGAPVVCIDGADDTEEERSSIDPTVFTGFDGSTYLVTGGGVIIGTEIDDSSYMPVESNNFQELARGPAEDDGYDWVEAAYVWPIESDGQNYYFLFVNWGACCSGTDSTYNIRVGRSTTSPLGPYVDKSGLDLMDGGGSLFLEEESYMIGPGHAGIYNDDVISFHYYDSRRDGASWVAERRVTVENGWPVAGELLSSYDGPAIGTTGTTLSCLSPFSLLRVLHKGAVHVADLEEGDDILISLSQSTRSGHDDDDLYDDALEMYSRVYAFGHKNSYTVTNFLQIETATSTTNEGALEISAEHLLYKVASNTSVATPIRADCIKVGDYLLPGKKHVDNNREKLLVTKITNVSRRGVYSPLTNEGYFIANGVKVSSYTATKAGPLNTADPQYFFQMGSVKIISYHDMSHVAISPIRWICRVGWLKHRVCKQRNSEGQLLFVAMAEKLSFCLMKQGFVAETSALLILYLILIPFYFTEKLLGSFPCFFSSRIVFSIVSIISIVSFWKKLKTYLAFKTGAKGMCPKGQNNRLFGQEEKL